MPTLADIRTRLPELRDMDDMRALRYIQTAFYPERSVVELAGALGVKPPEPEPPKRGLFDVANDTVIEFGNAVAGGAGAVADFVSPGNRFSRAVDDFVASGEAKQSQAVQTAKQRFHGELDSAEDWTGEVGAVSRYLLANPLLAAAQAAGSFVGPGVAVKGAGALGARMAARSTAGMAPEAAAAAVSQAAGRAGLAGGAVANAALTGGDAAGDAYRLAIEAGATEEEAQSAARQASALPAVVGAAGGMVGAERLLAGVGRSSANPLIRAARGAAVEGVQEAFEEGLTNYEARRAVQPIDPDIDPWKGTAGAAALGGALGAATGGAVGALSRGQPEQDPATKLATAKTVDQMISAATEMASTPLDTLPVERESADLVTRDDLANLTPELRREALEAAATARTPNAPLHVREAAAYRLGEILDIARQPAPLPPVGEVPPIDEATALARLDAVREDDEARLRQWDNRPSAIPTPPPGGYPAGPERVQIPERLNRPTRTRTPEAKDLDLLDGRADPVLEYVSAVRQVNTPAARAFVGEFDAGRITRRDVVRVMQSQPADPLGRFTAPGSREDDAAVASQRLSAAAKQRTESADDVGQRMRQASSQAAQRPAGIEVPRVYRSRTAASIQARRSGGEVLPVEGGFQVVEASDGVQQPDMASAARAPAVAGDERATDAVGSGMVAGRVPADAGRAADDGAAGVGAGVLAGAPGADGDGGGALTAAANEAATSPTNELPEPTDAQKEAGNYRLGHARVSGLDVSIENPKGSTRRSKSDAAEPWEVTMPAHYGYIRGSKGADGDHVDLFIGDRGDNGRFWIIDQKTPDGAKFDEHKVVTGADSADEAVRIYKASFADGFGEKVFAGIGHEMDAEAIKAKLPELSRPAPATRRAEVSNDETAVPDQSQQPGMAEVAIAPMPTVADIPRDVAQNAHRGTSHVPEDRAAQEQQSFMAALQDAWAQAARVAGQDQKALERIAETFREVADGYRARYLRALEARSRVMSPMIAGPARFPVERNRKRIETERRRAEEAQQYLARGAKRLIRAARGPVDNSPESELESIRLRLAEREETQETMKAANAALRKGDDAALEDIGFTAEQIADLKKGDFAGRKGFPDYKLANNSAEIRRLRSRLEEAEARMTAAQAGPTETEQAGVRIVEDAQDDRLRLFFDGKPDDAVRDDLKANGFKWSPKAGAWQRALTDNARAAARRILGKHFPQTSEDGVGNVVLFKRTMGEQSPVLQALADNDELFALPRSEGKTVSEIAFDIDPTIKVTSQTPGPGQTERWRVTLPNGGGHADISIRPPNRFGDTLYGFDLNDDGDMADLVLERPGENAKAIPEGTEDVILDASSVKEGGGGNMAYAIAGALAHNTGRIFIGDPAGLSPIALRRRPEQMLSLALKYGTTDFLAPHPDQIKGDRKAGVPPLKWVYGDDEGNIERLIALNVAAVENAFPAIRKVDFDVSTGQFVNADTGRLISRGGLEKRGDNLRDEADPALRTAAAGGRTLARTAWLRAVLREARREGEAGGGRDGVLDWLVALTGGDQHAAAGLFRRGDEGDVGSEQVARRIESLQGQVDRIASTWANAPTVRVVWDLQDPTVAKAVRDEDSRQRANGAAGTPAAFFHDGEVYIVASAAGGPADVARSLFHEAMGHYGLRAAFGDRLDAVLDRMATLNKAAVQAKAKEYGLSMADPKQRLRAAEETLAEIAEKRPASTWVRQAIAAIRGWLRENMPSVFGRMRLNDDEIIRDFILPARRAVERGGEKGWRADAAFARQRMAPMQLGEVDAGTSLRVQAAIALSAAKRKFAGAVVTNQSDGSKITIPASGLKHAASGSLTPAAVAALARVDDLVATATFLRAEPDKLARNTIKEVRHYERAAEIGGKPVVLRVVVRVHNDGSRYYDHFEAKENAPAGLSGKPGDQDSLRPFTGALPPTGGDGSVNDDGGADNGAAPMFQRRQAATLDDARHPFVTSQAVRDRVADILRNPGSRIGWFEKTIGTQYAKAQKHAEYRPVFDAVQDYIEDVSTMATEAADQAPSILPKLEGLRDIVDAAKRGLSAKDEKALAGPVFDGTLRYTRKDGRLVDVDEVVAEAEGMDTEAKARRLLRDGHVSQNELQRWQATPLDIYDGAVRNRYEASYLQPGVVFTDAELKGLYGLTDAQIGHYREFRKAVDLSLDQAVAADAIRLLGDATPELKRAAMNNRANLRPAIEQAIQQKIDAEEEIAKRDELAKVWNTIADKFSRVEDLKRRGYAPLMRFGKFFVSIRGDNDEQLFFGLYETRTAANRAARELGADPEFAGHQVQQGVISQEAYKLFAGVPVDSLEMFADALGGDQTAAFQAWLRLTKNNRSALKRLIKRKGTAGFSDDPTRVLASFVTSNARMASGAMNMLRAKQAAEGIVAGDVKDEAVKLIDSVQNPSQAAGAARGLMFMHFIGGSIASALVNATQPILMTMPYLSQWGGMAAASARLLSAARMATGGKIGDKALSDALHRAEQDGVVSPQEIHHLTNEAMASFGTNPWIKRLAFAWGAPFSLAEQFNRRSTFIAAWKTAKAEGMADPFDFARKAVIETQGLYNAGNAANIARNPVGALAMTFRQYAVHYLEWLGRMWNAGEPGSAERRAGRRAVLMAMALLVAVGGLDGLPFADDLEDAVDTAMQAMGLDTSVQGFKRDFLAKTLGLGDVATDVALRGLSALPGVPLDVSLRMGMGNLIPGTGLFLRSNTDSSRDLLEVAGPFGGLVGAYKDAGKKLLAGEFASAGEAVLPIALQNAAKATRMWMDGEYRDTRGRKVLDTDVVDGAMKFLGFQPAEVARESAQINREMRRVQLARNVETQIADLWARGQREGDIGMVLEARKMLADWNEANPDSRIAIDGNQIRRRVREMQSTRAERFVRSAPKEVRGSLAIGAQQ